MPTVAKEVRVRYEGGITTAEIQAALDGSTVLLEYFQVGEQYLAAMVTRTSVEIVPLTTESSLRRHVQMLQFQLAKFRRSLTDPGRREAPLLTATNRHLQEL